MEDLFDRVPIENYKVNDLIEGMVLKQDRNSLYVDIGFGVGIVFGKDFFESRNLIKKLRAGDKVMVKILESETPEGFVEISLKEADKEVIWYEAEKNMRERSSVNAVVTAANKGGLLLEWNGLSGFLPTSHLNSSHYPKVEGGSKEKILEELKKNIGDTFTVTISDINQKEESVIFSEKHIQSEGKKAIIAQYQAGDVVEGKVSGLVDFGIFMKIKEGLEGLVHISELDWSLVENPADFFKIGDTVQAKVVNIENEKISLSIKALKNNPWEEIKDQYQKGDIVSGVVIRFNKYGALVSIKEGVAGLIHVSEFGNEKNMKNKLELGKSYYFQITFFSPAECRLTFSFVEEK